MPELRFSEQSQAERAIGGDCATSPAQVAASAQCHPLDGTGTKLGPCPKSRKGTRSARGHRDETEVTKHHGSSDFFHGASRAMWCRSFESAVLSQRSRRGTGYALARKPA